MKDIKLQKMIIRNDIIEEILDLIEEKETKLLVWGIVDVYLTRNEVDDCIIKVIDNFNDLNTLEDDPSKVLEELIKRNLIFYIDLDNKKLRSRMAETIRLIYHLRQMFPKHANQNWQNAPTLVSDFRFIRRRRSVPIVVDLGSLEPFIGFIASWISLAKHQIEDNLRPKMRFAYTKIL